MSTSLHTHTHTHTYVHTTHLHVAIPKNVYDSIDKLETFHIVPSRHLNLIFRPRCLDSSRNGVKLIRHPQHTPCRASCLRRLSRQQWVSRWAAACGAGCPVSKGLQHLMSIGFRFRMFSYMFLDREHFCSHPVHIFSTQNNPCPTHTHKRESTNSRVSGRPRVVG